MNEILVDCKKCKTKQSLAVTTYSNLCDEEPKTYSKKYNTAICDGCDIDILLNGRETAIFHCYSGKHKSGYDLCVGCALKIYESVNK